LPFGNGYQLLEHDIGAPIAMPGVGSLYRTYDLFERTYIEPVDVDDLRADSARIGRPGRRPTRSGKGSGKMSGMLADYISRLDSTGLERSGELNDALFAKAIWCALLALTRDEALARVTGWLDERHNSRSETYNRDPNAAHAKAREIVSYVYATWRQSSSIAQRPGLTEYEATVIHSATEGDDDGEVADPETGDCFPRYKVEAFMFEVTDGMKQWVMTKCLFAARDVVARNPNVQIGSSEFDKLFATAVRRFWPNPNVPHFLVENPYTFRRTIEGVSEATATPLWRIAKNTGLFRMHRRAHQYSGRCETYAVWLDFNHSRTRTVRTMSEALVAMLPPSEIRAQYSAHYARRIRDEGRLAVTTGLASDDDVGQYVTRRLDGIGSHGASDEADEVKAA
jgi:hypothetical protein